MFVCHSLCATVFQIKKKYIIYLISRVEGILVLKGLFGTFVLLFFKWDSSYIYTPFATERNPFTKLVLRLKLAELYLLLRKNLLNVENS